MSKQLYTVTLTTQTVVCASSPKEAEAIAHKESRKILECADDLDGSLDIAAAPLATLPTGWDEDCLPYGGDGETTIGEILRGEVSK